LGYETLAHLDCKVDLVDRAEDLVDFADGRLVGKVDGCVEVGHFGGVGRGAEHLAFDSVDELSHFF
jgi:hypothetical protein